MVPHKAWCTQEAVPDFDATQFHTPEVEKYYLQMNERTFIQEWWFNPSLTGCDNIGELVDFHHRRNFCSTLNEPAVDVIVYEFYASLKDREIHKIPSEIHMHVMVRGKKVLATPREIYFYYDAPYYASDLLDYVDLNMYRGIDMDAILRYLTQGARVPMSPASCDADEECARKQHVWNEDDDDNENDDDKGNDEKDKPFRAFDHEVVF
ncbi:hypothetical protein PVK06_026605 [Gossypium arboreum]|uniref:Uncharacterized protein n=1 Tax=Gossypium arboreum TaxID=29729 RepID=A0ABR0NYF7_GOSAR|nr:hypothetical protein PVK06_026605 [Gossypium arboreum]